MRIPALCICENKAADQLYMCSCVVLDQVGNPAYRFSHETAHLVQEKIRKKQIYRCILRDYQNKIFLSFP